METLLPSWPLFSAFLIASFVLAITPGPGVFYIVMRSITQGRSSGLASVAGVALGNLSNALGAAIGLAAVFALSSIAFAVVKYAGAAYLVYLGLQALRTRTAMQEIDLGATRSLATVFGNGFVVALLNPKTALFFAAFLPQFIGNANAPIAQTMLLGAIFVAIAAVTDSAYALTAGAVASFAARTRRLGMIGAYLSGSVFIALGFLTAFSGSKASK
jgi:threonine/homoserine/homoserine lactone efflux protein